MSSGNINREIKVTCNLQDEVAWRTLTEIKNFDISTPGIFVLRTSDFENQKTALIQLLDENELLKSERFFNESDKNRFILTKSILKLLLARYTGIQPASVRFEEGINKKPEIAASNSIRFSVSHSGEWSVFAIGKEEIGIDIEKINGGFAYDEIIDISFNQKEKAFILQHLEPHKMFFQLWTRKEALTKATAKGIDDDLSLIPSLDGEHLLNGEIIGDERNWTVSTIHLNNSHIISLAYLSDSFFPANLFLLRGSINLK